MSKFDYNVSELNIIYAYALPDVTTHVGHLKVGKASIKSSDYFLADDKGQAIEQAVRARIKSQLSEAELRYDLVFYGAAVTNEGHSFMDHEVHDVLKNSGFPKIPHTDDKKYGEWFAVSRETVENAYNAVREGRASLKPDEIVKTDTKIKFREGSQTIAIHDTLAAIKKGKKHFLWDAKMRFGKTLTSLEVARQMNYGKVLIITHRPEVDKDWFKDFNTLFAKTNYRYGSRSQGENISNLQSRCIRKPDGSCINPFIYFASIQYLRHQKVSPEKRAILDEDWDMLIIDEADEGVKTALADEIISQITRKFTLMLSGTPFNLLEDYEADEIYSWDYTKEQELKQKWDELHPDEPNPYYKLPKLSIYTYALDKYLHTTDFENLYDKAFNFKEFFRTDDDGSFIHEQYVVRFLDLLTTESDNNFPYSRSDFRNNLRHMLWIVPGVKEARALEKLLRKHPIFGMKDNNDRYYFNIANIAGEGNEEVAEKESRKLVRSAITDDPLSAYSITISCGKMTRGVSVPEWTAVFMLSNTSSASTYLQTIFRAQTPWEYQGLVKQDCFVFDFAPDRTLNVVAETMKIKKKSPTKAEVKEATSKFLNFCPVISVSEGRMEEFSPSRLLHAIKRVAIQKVTRNGFDDTRLYNLDNLEHCSDEELADFAELNRIVGQSSSGVKDENKITMADNGFTDEEYEQAEQAEKKKREKRELTPEEQELLRRKREIAEQRKTRISILRGISIRMPMLIYGCRVDKDNHEIRADEEISLEQFIDNIDDTSWAEFMPEGVTKDMLREKFAKYYDDEVFIGAGIDIRLRALAADHLAPSERVMEIGEIFKSFKNPDKETVLTPWSVVNSHISSTLGGADFNHIIEFKDEIDQSGEKLGLPNWVDKGQISELWNNQGAKVLEINSKSGLYPLLCAYNFYSQSLVRAIKDGNKSEEDIFRALWDEILANNIYVLTKSPMAKSITERTLAGYTGAKTNVVYIPDLIEKLKDKDYNLNQALAREFKLEGDGMLKFDAVIGNPPYQETISKSEAQTQGNSNWIYQYFQEGADKLGGLTCLIYPFGGWFDAPNRLGGLGKKILSDGHTISVDAYEGTTDRRAWYRNDRNPQPIFGTSANLSAGVSVVFRDLNHTHNEYKYSNRIYTDESATVKTSDIDLLVPNPTFLKIAAKLFGPKLNNRIKKGIFGIESNFVEQNPDKVSDKASDWGEPIRLLTNDQSGSAGRAQWYWTDKTTLPKGGEYVPPFKIVMASAYPKKTLASSGSSIDKVRLRVKELFEIMPQNSAFGRSRLALFMSDNKNECDNFMKYTQTKFFAVLTLQEPNKSSSFGYVIPDQDFSNNSDIDWSKDLTEIDRQLFQKYNVTEEEQKFLGVVPH